MSRKTHLRNIMILLLIAAIGGYWFLSRPDKAQQDLAALQGQAPTLKTMRSENFPTIAIPDVTGWAKGTMPVAAVGLDVKPFAGELAHPRNLYVLPNGDVLVAESNAPERATKGATDWLTRKLILKSNAGGAPANRITLLRDEDGDGVAETRHTLVQGLNSPFGMALVGDRLFVGNTDSVIAYPYKAGQTEISAKPERIMDLPAQFPNNHWARNLLYDPKENMLYVSIGSNSNIAENDPATEKDRAQIKQYNLKTKETTIFGYGLRNPTGLAFNPTTGTLWTSVNERDMLGSDGPPDYLTSVTFGTFYGWPYFYWGQNEDRRVVQNHMELKQYSKRPDYALGPHVAALGVAFSPGNALGGAYARGMFVAEHGSWNRVPKSGYRVVFVPFNERGFPVDKAKPVDVLSGFLSKDEKSTSGRPASVAFDATGMLLVADDSGNTIWRVTPKRVAVP
jgi:glucose/arabinose dehydrogenase